MFRGCAALFYGFFVWSRLLIKDRKTYYVISDQGIGDIFPTCAFLPAYRDRNHVEHITLLGIKGKEDLYKMYAGTYDRLLLFSKRRYKYLTLFSSLDIGYAFRIFSGRILSTRVGSNSRGDYVNRIKTLTYLDTIKYGVYDLNNEDEMQRPNIPEVEIGDLIRKYELKAGKTVILNPYANSIENIDIRFFSDLAHALKHRGYQVITNLSYDSQQAVEGTEGIICSLAEAYHLANYCGYVVGMRSGFFDFIAYAKCKLILLFPEQYPFFDYQKLSRWGISSEVTEMKVGGDWLMSINYILSYLTGDNTDEE